MTEVTSDRPDAPSRPEDATTLEEFQARRDADLARLDGTAAHWGDGWRATLIVAVTGIDAFYWYRFSHATGTERWHVLALSLLFLCSLVSGCSVLARRIAGRRERRCELERLGAQWQARAS
jgi:hypothetical protein